MTTSIHSPIGLAAAPRRNATAGRREQLLMAPLLVWHALLDGLAPAAVHHCRDRLDDEEEHRRRYGHELEEVGEERAVAKNGVVDREREVAEVWFPITIAITGVTMLLTKELMTAAKATHDERDRQFDDVLC
jgi:hypothetical protein